MTITIKTIIGYDPVTEKEEIEQFIANTEISKRSVSETTTTTCFERTERWFSDNAGGDE